MHGRFEDLVSMLKELSVTQSNLMWEDAFMFCEQERFDLALKAAEHSTHPYAHLLRRVVLENINNDGVSVKKQLSGCAKCVWVEVVSSMRIHRPFSTTHEERFEAWMKLAFENNREAISRVAWHYFYGFGCPLNRARAATLDELAALRRQPVSCKHFSERFLLTDPQRWYWMSEACCRQPQFCDRLLAMAAKVWLKFEKHGCGANLLFYLGSLWKNQEKTFKFGPIYGPLDLHQRGYRHCNDKHEHIFLEIVRFSDICCEKSRQECIAWVLCAKKLNLYKVIRVMIAMRVWDLRMELEQR